MDEMTKQETTATETPRRTAADMLAAWDRGDVVTTVEMGGLGPGYEQCIQIAVMELIRDHVESGVPTFADADHPTATEQAAWREWGNATLDRVDGDLGGMSGAQAGAAKGLAYRILRDGWDATLDSMRAHDADRLTMVSRAWPKAPEAPAHA